MVPLTPDQALQLAFAHHRAGRVAEAAELYRLALAGDPRQADAWHQLGIIALTSGKGAEAADAIAKAVALRPAEANYHANLGIAFSLLGRPEDAAASFRRALALQPALAHIHSALGDVLCALGRTDEATACYRRSIELQPNAAGPHNNLGNAFLAKGRLEDAAECYHRATQLDPNLVQAQCNLGDAWTKLGRFDAAQECLQRLTARWPDFPGGHVNLGIVFWRKGEFAQARVCFERAIQCDPQHADAHLSLGLLHLLLGNFREGWREYEWRFRSTALTRPPRQFTAPRWDGTPAPGRTIVVHADQGFGDTIHFLRYLPLVRERSGGARVILECQPELVRLIAQSGGAGVEVVAQADHADFHVPLLSLPLALDLPEPLPMAQPYLSAPTNAQFEPVRASTGLRVGIAWAGSPMHRDDRWRTIPFERLRPLLGVPGAQFYSLQLTPPAPPDSGLIDLTAHITDFADTAALVSELDLVITADSAVAHLAGTLGRPVWVLLPFVPDWRWGLGREDTPWYPAMRLFRQPRAGDWESVVQRVAAALTAISRPGASR